MKFKKSIGGTWFNEKDGIFLSLVKVVAQFNDDKDFYRLEKHDVEGMNEQEAYDFHFENDDYEFESFNELLSMKFHMVAKYGIVGINKTNY